MQLISDPPLVYLILFPSLWVLSPQFLPFYPTPPHFKRDEM